MTSIPINSWLDKQRRVSRLFVVSLGEGMEIMNKHFISWSFAAVGSSHSFLWFHGT